MTAERTVLDWTVIDATLPAAKMAGAALGWGNSLVTNVVCCVWFEELATGEWSRIAVAVGLISWFVLLVAQLYTVSRHEIANIVTSFPDILMTAVPWYYGFAWFFSILIGTAGLWLAFPLAWYLGVISGRGPERLLLGRRPPGARPLWVRVLFF